MSHDMKSELARFIESNGTATFRQLEAFVVERGVTRAPDEAARGLQVVLSELLREQRIRYEMSTIGIVEEGVAESLTFFPAGAPGIG